MKHVQAGSLSFAGGTMTIERGGKLDVHSFAQVAQVTCSCGWKSENALTPDEAAEQFAAHQVAGKGRARR